MCFTRAPTKENQHRIVKLLDFRFLEQESNPVSQYFWREIEKLPKKLLGVVIFLFHLFAFIIMKLSIPFHAITSLVLLGTSTTSATSNLRRRLQHKDSKGHQDDARSLSTPTAVAYEYEMLLAPGGACRINSPSNSGTQNTDFFRSKQPSLSTCQNMCSIRSDCVAIEFSENNGDCEIWITLPNKVGDVSGAISREIQSPRSWFLLLRRHHLLRLRMNTKCC